MPNFIEIGGVTHKPLVDLTRNDPKPSIYGEIYPFAGGLQPVVTNAVAEWVRALAWAGDRTVSRPGSNPATVTSLRNFGNSVYPALPVSFGGDTKKPSVPSIWCLCQGK